jgi:hypothetical protein
MYLQEGRLSTPTIMSYFVFYYIIMKIKMKIEIFNKINVWIKSGQKIKKTGLMVQMKAGRGVFTISA